MATIEWPSCVLAPPKIVGDPCRPRWVIRCSHGWFFHQTLPWTDKRDEQAAYVALWGLHAKVHSHTDIRDGLGRPL